MMMKMKHYKLKDHVTDEMLVACGFKIMYDLFATRRCVDYKKIFIPLIEKSHYSFGIRYVEFSKRSQDNLDITPYIQDLIDMGYVEVVE